MAVDDRRDSELDVLLDLNGLTMEIGGGYWVSMVVNRVPQDAGRPAGIQYALSLHAPGGDRVLGYDNAHRVPAASGPAARSATRLAFDHLHRGGRVLPYEFRSPGDLLEDFWADVEAHLKAQGIP